MARAAPRIVRLDDYRRNSWSASDLTWEHVALKAVVALARGEQLRIALLLPQAESVARLHTSPDDPRRAASLTLLARWQQEIGNEIAGERLRGEAERLWRASLDWLERLRPGGSAEGQNECRCLLQRATTFTAALAEPANRRLLPPTAWPVTLVGLPADRRKLEAAVAAAIAWPEAEPPKGGLLFSEPV